MCSVIMLGPIFKICISFGKWRLLFTCYGYADIHCIDSHLATCSSSSVTLTWKSKDLAKISMLPHSTLHLALHCTILILIILPCTVPYLYWFVSLLILKSSGCKHLYKIPLSVWAELLQPLQASQSVWYSVQVIICTPKETTRAFK